MAIPDGTRISYFHQITSQKFSHLCQPLHQISKESVYIYNLSSENEKICGRGVKTKYPRVHSYGGYTCTKNLIGTSANCGYTQWRQYSWKYLRQINHLCDRDRPLYVCRSWDKRNNTMNFSVAFIIKLIILVSSPITPVIYQFISALPHTV
jgi:hypothetical protein